jgi:hydroxyacylglutathione hydrolase
MILQILEALRDNYIFVLTNPLDHTAAVVDPSEAAPVLQFLKSENLELTAILNTHHHHDHVGGNLELLKYFPKAVVYGGKNEGRIPAQKVFLAENDSVSFGKLTARVLDIPGHTRGHIAYHFENEHCLFSGDTLFGGTCGAIFEGTPEIMFQSLSKIEALPPNTQICCSHEYTALYIDEALRLDPRNTCLQQRAQKVRLLHAAKKRTVPLSLEEELQTNPYLRCNNTEFATQYGTPTGIKTFLKIISMG